MAATKTKSTKKSAKSATNGKPVAGSNDVLTLAEAAAYLRVPEGAVLHAISAQDLPAREIGGEWRIFKTSLQKWLDGPPKRFSKDAFLALAGVWKDDPYIDEMLKEIYKKRGRPMTEDGE
jgi:excisionase family DNA binding protein